MKKTRTAMIRGAFPTFLLALTLTLTPEAFTGTVPALISEPDYPDTFTIFAAPRSDLDAPGNATRGGYPVFPNTYTDIFYMTRQGERLPVPVAPRAYPLPGITVAAPEH